ncbi:uncharacterized protein [Dermacentor andersoni]|uniref:uncharacterized protein n=1 Tax=Dermacentor andersoni TaxID=34620 RepID=UPI0021559655|nr:uncharacterized protein LOC126541672 [Dermacentor andersoni]
MIYLFSPHQSCHIPDRKKTCAFSARLLHLALFAIAGATVIQGAPTGRHICVDGDQRDVCANAVVSSGARVVQTPGQRTGEEEDAVHLCRQRRQTKLLCLGNAVVTTLVSTLLERNRDRIKENEPIYIGGTQNLGVIVLKNGRGVNVHTAFFNGEINVDCISDPNWISITFPVGIRNPDIVFDYELPGGLLSGELKARFELFGANVVLRLPKDRSGDLKPYIADVNFWSTQGFKMEITGMGPVSSVLTTGLTLVYQLMPMPLMEFFRVLMMRVMQQFLETAPLPF